MNSDGRKKEKNSKTINVGANDEPGTTQYELPREGHKRDEQHAKSSCFTTYQHEFEHCLWVHKIRKQNEHSSNWTDNRNSHQNVDFTGAEC